MPRRYALGKRGDLKADTRARIIAAAAAIYRDRGMGAASNLAIARAADVAPATVRNHFPTASLLADAVYDAVLEELRPPGPEIFEAFDGLRPRLHRLAVELVGFYERSEPWWRVYQREPGLAEAWATGADRYYRDIDALIRVALGPLGSDAQALAVVAALTGPTFFAFRERGQSSDEAVELCLELALPWLEGRHSAAAEHPAR